MESAYESKKLAQTSEPSHTVCQGQSSKAYGAGDYLKKVLFLFTQKYETLLANSQLE